MQAAIVTASAEPRPPPAPRTSRIPAATASTPAISPPVGLAPTTTTTITSASTGARPRASGYTRLSSKRRYAAASRTMYASSSAAEPATYGQAALSIRQVAAASGASTTTNTTSETALVAA